MPPAMRKVLLIPSFLYLVSQYAPTQIPSCTNSPRGIIKAVVIRAAPTAKSIEAVFF